MTLEPDYPALSGIRLTGIHSDNLQCGRKFEFCFRFLLLFAVLTIMLQTATSVRAAESAVFYAIRHAEKVEDGTADPDLSPVGYQRAQSFAELLRDKAITHIFSTSFRRTMKSAEPIAAQHNLPIEQYDGGNLPGLVEKLKSLRGTIVVMGHSNTTTRVVNLLTGSDLEDLDERTYDRIYVVSKDESGEASFWIEYTEPRTPLD